MQLQGIIIDLNSGSPLPGATISQQQPNGSFQPIGQTDSTGSYNITVPDGSAVLQFGTVGYTPVQESAASILNNSIVSLSAASEPALSFNPIPAQQQATALPAPVSAAQAATNAVPAVVPAGTSISPWLIVGAAGAGLLLLSSMGKKKKKISGFDWEQLIVPGALIIGGYLLVSNLGNLFTSSANNSNNASIDQTTAAANDQLVQNAQAAGAQATLSSSQISSLATDIFNQGNSGNWFFTDAQQQQIVADLSQVKSLLDYANLKKAFGTKQWGSSTGPCGLLGIFCSSYDLDSFVKANLSSTNLAQVNATFAANGVNYQL